MDLDRVTREIVSYIKEDSEAKYRLIIGTDSEGKGEVYFVTAIIIYRKKKGGRYFWKKISQEKIFNLRQKIYKEVEYSLLISQELIKKLNLYSTDIIFQKASMTNMMKKANKMGAKYVLILGDQEQKDCTVTVKNMQSGKSETVKQTDIIKCLM